MERVDGSVHQPKVDRGVGRTRVRLIAPGARIVVRDEEWLVRRVDPSSDDGRC